MERTKLATDETGRHTLGLEGKILFGILALKKLFGLFMTPRSHLFQFNSKDVCPT
jgi:hypothetical protein